MHHAADPAELHGGACLEEERGVGFAVVPQGIELGGVAEGGGQAREVLGPAGIQADVVRVRALAEVLLIEPVQLGLGEDVAAVAEVLQRLGLPQLQSSGGGVAEDLQPQGGPFRSRVSWAATALRLAPALSPMTASLLPSMPRAMAFS